MRILIIKRGALGDVLRTTALLASLKSRWPDSELCWLTSPEARPLLEGNPYLGRLSSEADGLLLGRFDRVLSMEEDPAFAALEKTVHHGLWTGVVLRGGRLAYTADSAAYYDLSLLHLDPDGGHASADELKQTNTLTYEQLWLKALDLPDPPQPPQPVLRLTEEDAAQADYLAQRLGIADLPLRIGIHPGAGARWPSKRIPEETTLALAREVRRRWGVPLILFGGPEEAAAHPRLAAAAGGDLLDLGADYGLRVFAALLARCDVLVSSDSLALHAARALSRPVVAAFGPTSAGEVRLAHGTTLLPPGGCGCWYRSGCSRSKPCLGEIPLGAWIDAIAGLLPPSQPSPASGGG